MERRYYEAYDDRYRQVHAEGLTWFQSDPSPVVREVMNAYGIGKQHRLLEIGCGEGRDAAPLLREGYALTATDISPAAIDFCRRAYPEKAESFRVLDCIRGECEERFDFIYAVAVLHMLVEDADREAFYRFLREHLAPGGIGLICSMGNGQIERCSDPQMAFELREREHWEDGRRLQIAATSCRMVTHETFRREIRESGLRLLQERITEDVPGFAFMMVAVVQRGEAALS